LLALGRHALDARLPQGGPLRGHRPGERDAARLGTEPDGVRAPIGATCGPRPEPRTGLSSESG
jgi:hypothetical protein